MTVTDAVKSVGNSPPSLQYAASGTKVSVEETATKMISISDNTAADMLIGLLGRDRVEAQVRQWAANASANEPFLTTREMILLHYVAGLGDRYLATPRHEREAFLAVVGRPAPDQRHRAPATRWTLAMSNRSSGSPPPMTSAARSPACSGCRRNPRLSPLSTILSLQVAGIGLEPSAWPTVWFKGGSESGVLTLGWLATNRHGKTFVVEAMVTNPDAALSANSITDLVALANTAFGLLG